jgi:hypothetical protein
MRRSGVECSVQSGGKRPSSLVGAGGAPLPPIWAGGKPLAGGKTPLPPPVSPQAAPPLAPAGGKLVGNLAPLAAGGVAVVEPPAAGGSEALGSGLKGMNVCLLSIAITSSGSSSRSGRKACVYPVGRCVYENSPGRELEGTFRHEGGSVGAAGGAGEAIGGGAAGGAAGAAGGTGGGLVGGKGGGAAGAVCINGGAGGAGGAAAIGGGVGGTGGRRAEAATGGGAGGDDLAVAGMDVSTGAHFLAVAGGSSGPARSPPAGPPPVFLSCGNPPANRPPGCGSPPPPWPPSLAPQPQASLPPLPPTTAPAPLTALLSMVSAFFNFFPAWI